MNVEELRSYCLNMNGATESFPFDEVTLVFKVMNKIFAIIPLEKGACINLKCDPERAVSLREHHSAITAGYHMNKKHWNTVWTEKLMNPKLTVELIVQSYDLIVNSLSKKLQQELELL